MKGGLYIRLAASGISKNRKLYFPYLTTCICMVMMFYIVTFLAGSRNLKNLPGAETLQTLLGLGVFVIGLFSVIFLNYTDSFLFRRRQKEFGLYNILGMGKGNLVKILVWENLITAVASIVLGMVFGILFSRLAELLAARIISGDIGFGFTVEPVAVRWTAVLFAVIFLLITLRMMVKIYSSRPVEMLRSEKVGEKPPKANWLFALLGVVILAGAYYLAVSIQEPMTAFALFFVAVIMVIVATYLLFLAGSVALCRLLQKNKNYYYKTRHFVSLSSMVYRMKRNGAGLASICILSTMVLVTVSSTVCLFAGTEESLNRAYPRQIALSIYSLDREKDVDPIVEAMSDVVEEHGLEKKNIMDYRVLSVAGYQTGDRIVFDPDKATDAGVNILEGIRSVQIIPLEDYNRIMGTDETLEEDEMLIYADKGSYDYDTISLENCGTWKIKKQVDEYSVIEELSVDISQSYYLFVKDTSVLARIEAGEGEIYGDHMSLAMEYYGFDLDCPEDEQMEIYQEMNDQMDGLAQTADGTADESLPAARVDSRAYNSSNYYGMTGGLFFLGILLGVVFLFGTVLIMYYKQISEGYEDQDRFSILMKVGMSRREVKQSINSQVLTVFFLPLIMAGIHLVFAFPLISKLLVLLISTDEKLLMIVTAVCFVVFALFYMLVYAVTSREYFRIVSGKKESRG